MTSVSDRRHRKERTAARLKLKGIAWPLHTNSNSFVSEEVACARASCLRSCKTAGTMYSTQICCLLSGSKIANTSFLCVYNFGLNGAKRGKLKRRPQE